MQYKAHMKAGIYTMWYDENYKYGIAVKNFALGFSNDEEIQLRSILNEQHIGLTFFETRSIENSIFQTFCIYVNEHLTELIVTGLIAPAAYDAIKTAIFSIVKRITNLVHKTKKDEPLSSLRIKIGHAEIIAPVPNDLNNEQFSIYMAMIQNSLKEVNQYQLQSEKNYECFIIEYDEERKKMIIKTIVQYGMEQIQKQKEKKDNK